MDWWNCDAKYYDEFLKEFEEDFLKTHPDLTKKEYNWVINKTRDE